MLTIIMILTILPSWSTACISDDLYLKVMCVFGDGASIRYNVKQNASNNIDSTCIILWQHCYIFFQILQTFTNSQGKEPKHCSTVQRILL